MRTATMRNRNHLISRTRNSLGLILGLVSISNLGYCQEFNFEVASVKPSPPADGRGRAVRATGVPGSPFGKDPGRFVAENFSLPNLITMAYDIPYYRTSGLDGLNMTTFNVEARMPTDTTAQQFQIMLRNLLAERFGLKVHWVSRETAMYELTVTKGGSKLKEAVPDSATEENDLPAKRAETGPPKLGPDGYPIPPPGRARWMAIMGDKAFIRGNNATLSEITTMFSLQIGSPVTDATGLTGKYDYTLYWSTSATHAAISVTATAETGALSERDPTGPGLIEAIREQLGLKMEAKKGPLQVLVVDHVETKPTAN